MNQLKSLFYALSLSQRIGIAAVTLALAAGMISFVHWRHEAGFKPLFTGMSPEDAAAVVQRLKESGVEHRLADNGNTVLVPEAKVDELRLELAGAGLPKSGRIGFELFDKTNLGITDFAEHVNYRRALEGELERSIKVLNGIEQARVHITFPKDSVFLDSREPAKASVLVSLRPGARLTQQNVLAITNLVASAVEGLAPDYISVIDMQGNLLSRPHQPGFDDADAPGGVLEYRHQIERDLAAKVESTLQPLLGDGRFRVGVTADCDFTTSKQTDEVFDPTKSVMVSSQKSEDIAAGSQTSGVPGTPANLPRSTAPRPEATPSTASRKTENVAYQSSRTVREVKTPRGAIKRISASILLDQDFRWEGKGPKAHRVDVPPTPEKLKAIHDIAAGVLGLVPERGDQLVIESLPFEQTREGGEAEPTSPLAPAGSQQGVNELLRNKPVLIGGAALLVLIAAAVGMMLRRKSVKTPVEAQRAIVASETRPSLEPAAAASAKLDESQQKLTLPAVPTRVDTLRQSLRETVTRDPALAASVIRGWLEEDAAAR